MRATIQSRGRFQPVVDGGTLALIEGCFGSTETTRSSVDVESKKKVSGVLGFFIKRDEATGRAGQSLGGRCV